MKRNHLGRIALSVLCLALVQCTASTTVTPGPPTAFTAVRLTANGPADNTFGGTGIVVTPTNTSLNNFAVAVAIQPDNKIVAVGSNGLAGQGQIALVRYNDADGSLDKTGFGTGGTGVVLTTLAFPALASAVAVQPADSKIVVAALVFNPATSATSMAVLRYNTDGSPDLSFNTSGVTAFTPIGPGLVSDTCAMFLQGGNIVVAGAAQNGTLVLARYTSAGAVDTTFGTTGTTTTALAAPASDPKHNSPAMATQSDGRIIVVTRNGDDQAVLRFSADGAPDTTFGGATNGIVITDIGNSVNYANAVAIQDASGAPGNTDKIVVAGHTNLTQNTSDISLVRYSKDGVLDTTFGSGGIVTTDIANQFDNALAVLLQDFSAAEPRILVSGNTGFGSSTQMVVLRYLSDGTADTTFGSAARGQVFVPVVGPSTIASGNALAIQPGHGIVVAGFD